MLECCASGDSSPPPPAAVLASVGNDPTLQSCCARDLKEQAYAGWLKGELLARDRTSARLDIASSVFASPAVPNAICDQEEIDSLDSDGDEGELCASLVHRSGIGSLHVNAAAFCRTAKPARTSALGAYLTGAQS